jgi:Asp-tRNA(Asn)/Glu-tRNA(Gln) amidotransferase C subunit|tara:strand:+ start:460 stop:651 length:192 start_codon:yes stop_codon:yes gene_type:complete
MENSNYEEITIQDMEAFSKLSGIKIAEDRIQNTIRDINRINQGFFELNITNLGNSDPAFTLKL